MTELSTIAPNSRPTTLLTLSWNQLLHRKTSHGVMGYALGWAEAAFEPRPTVGSAGDLGFTTGLPGNITGKSLEPKLSAQMRDRVDAHSCNTSPIPSRAPHAQICLLSFVSNPTRFQAGYIMGLPKSEKTDAIEYVLKIITRMRVFTPLFYRSVGA